jgi:surfeit locus 1 family protein
MKLGNDYQFLPSLIPTLLMLVVFPLFIALGIWQLNRAAEKRQIDQGVHNAQKMAALNLNRINKTRLSKLVYRKATLSGHYDKQHQLLLDNRTHQGKPGYHVLTPLLLSGQDKPSAVLINRGWIPYSGTRDNIPDISVDDRARTLTGIIKKPAKSIVLQKEHSETTGNQQYPQLIQSIALNKLATQLQVTLLPIIIELDKNDKDGFVRDWQPYYGSVDKHNAYALQWFAMAAILLFLYLKLNTKKMSTL